MWKGVNISAEARGGFATFLTMSYIVFVQPAVLSQAGMDFGSVMMATIISSVVATLIMGIFANYPIALAPGMGENFFFAFTIVLGMGIPWQTALGGVFVAGVIFLVISLLGLRQKVIAIIPPSLKSAIAVGIGLFIAFIGFIDSGIIIRSQGTPLSLGNLAQPPVLLALFGLAITTVLLVRKVKGAILFGMLSSLIVGLITGVVRYQGIFSLPPSVSPTFLRMDIAGVFRPEMVTVVLVFLFMDFFDTIGTIVAVAERMGIVDDKGNIPRAGRVLLADAIGTVVGALFGTSTVTSFIESLTGVAEGAKTGLANIFTSLGFLACMFLYPLVKMVGGGYQLSETVTLYPITGPILIIVGAMMATSFRDIEWKRYDEAIPAFLAMLGMPLTYSISNGLALGFISYAVIKPLVGKGKELHPIFYIVAAIFLAKYIFIGFSY